MRPIMAIAVGVACLGLGCAGAEGLTGGFGSGALSTTVGSPTGVDTGDTDDPSDSDPSNSGPVDTSDTDDPSDPSDTDPSDTDDPPPSCGDAVVDPGEQCDLGDGNSDVGPCKSDCTNQLCGDGFVGPGESCDDANVVNEDSCTNACILASCGDGQVNGAGEQCDDGNGDNADACPGTCLSATCGDGFVYGGVESCDEGAATASCDADCTPASCGDGTTNAAAGEACDDANGDNGDACPNCQNAFCGDGHLRAGVEACDDGNGNSGDGCSSACESELPMACDGGVDPVYGSPWVVCAADANSAWISALNGGGLYHADLICQSLGYATFSALGGNCDSVCGYCDGATSCMNTGSQVFDGGGYCGVDDFGLYLCYTVTWLCSN